MEHSHTGQLDATQGLSKVPNQSQRGQLNG